VSVNFSSIAPKFVPNPEAKTSAELTPMIELEEVKNETSRAPTENQPSPEDIGPYPVPSNPKTATQIARENIEKALRIFEQEGEIRVGKGVNSYIVYELEPHNYGQFASGDFEPVRKWQTFLEALGAMIEQSFGYLLSETGQEFHIRVENSSPNGRRNVSNLPNNYATIRWHHVNK
jgi:hypothetical protein